MPNGRIQNYSDKTLWVVENDSGSVVAHKLAPGRRSPASVDADGFKAVDGTPVDGHTSWVKVTDISSADVANSGPQLTRGCIACFSVGEDEFGPVTYDAADGWGEPIDP